MKIENLKVGQILKNIVIIKNDADTFHEKYNVSEFPVGTEFLIHKIQTDAEAEELFREFAGMMGTPEVIVTEMLEEMDDIAGIALKPLIDGKFRDNPQGLYNSYIIPRDTINQYELHKEDYMATRRTKDASN